MIRLISLSAKLSLAVLVLSFSTCSTNEPEAVSLPSVTGPLRVTDDSYPFGSAATTTVPQDLSLFGYVEEEFLISGSANVYDWDPDGKVIIKTPDAPYTTRILIRRPADADKFSGTVIVELLNPSLMFDWDPQMSQLPPTMQRANLPTKRALIIAVPKATRSHLKTKRYWPCTRHATAI